MTTTRPIVELPDDCAATLIPSGMTAILHAGDTLVVSQALGFSLRYLGYQSPFLRLALAAA